MSSSPYFFCRTFSNDDILNSPEQICTGLPAIRSVATMEKIAEADECGEGQDRAGERQEEEGVAARRARRERRLTDRRLSAGRTLTAVWQPARLNSLTSSPSLVSLRGSSSAARLARPLSRKDIFYSGSLRQLDQPGLTTQQSMVSIGGKCRVVR